MSILFSILFLAAGSRPDEPAARSGGKRAIVEDRLAAQQNAFDLPVDFPACERGVVGLAVLIAVLDQRLLGGIKDDDVGVGPRNKRALAGLETKLPCGIFTARPHEVRER